MCSATGISDINIETATGSDTYDFSVRFCALYTEEREDAIVAAVKRGAHHAILHGPVRLVAGVATRLRRFTPTDLVPGERARWQQLRQAIRRRFALRAQGRQFRRNPDAYLKQLEENCFKLALPT